MKETKASLLSHYLESDGQTVHNSTDTMIAACALQIANEGMEVNVVADDTDVLILMYHWRESMEDACLSQRNCDTTSATFGHGKTNLLKGF